MGKKNKIASNLKTIAAAIKEKPAWDIDWDRVKTFDDISEAKNKFKLILESNIGNRDEDVAYIESKEESSDYSDFDGQFSISDIDNNSNLGE